MEMMAHHLHPPETKNGIRDAQKVKEFYLFGMIDIHLDPGILGLVAEWIIPAALDQNVDPANQLIWQVL